MHVSSAKHSYDYQESVTTEQTHPQTDPGQSDPYVPLCFTGDTKMSNCAMDNPGQPLLTDTMNDHCYYNHGQTMLTHCQNYVPLYFAGDTKLDWGLS